MILIDLEMPKLDVFVAIKKILRLNENQAIIGCTLKISKVVKQECLEHGMKDILYKPAEKWELKRILLLHTFGLNEEEVIMYLSQTKL